MICQNYKSKPVRSELSTTEITEEKIAKAIDKLKSSKSQGPDNIHPKLLKETKSVIIKPLKIIYKKSISEQKIPESWKQAHVHVTPLFKKGSRQKTENYRPISLTSVPGKMLERLIRDDIVNHMTINHLFSDVQHNYWNVWKK